MSTEISTQLKSVQDRVRDRIQTEFLALIPQELWEKMVNAEIQRFLSEPRYDQWGNRARNDDSTPVLKDLVREAINKAAKDKIAVELSSSKWNGNWNGTEYEVGEAIKKMIVDHGDLIWKTLMVGMMEAVAQLVLQNFKNQLQQWNPGMRTF